MILNDSITKYNPITIQTTNFKIVPAANHRKDQKADFNAWACFLPAIFSPKYAPRNGHAISPRMPNGPMLIHNIGRIITAMISQMVLHVTHHLVHQNFLVHITGMT